MILSFFLSGVALGFTQGCSPGPHSALVVSETLRRNARKGSIVAFAPVIATIPILAITLPLAAFFSNYKLGLAILALIGGAYLLYIAWETARTSQFEVQDSNTAGRNPFWLGFNAALLSPHPYLFWSTAGATLLLGAYKAGLLAALLFLSSFLGVFFIAKLGLVFLASRLKSGVEGKGFVVLMRVLSLALVFFAVTLWVDAFKLMGVIL